MIEFVTSPKGLIAANIFDQVKEALNIVQASQWMFTPNAWLDGRTPIGAIREGDAELVERAVNRLKENVKAA